MSMTDEVTLSELETRIAAIRENMLIEQAAALSVAADEDRTANRIADQEAKLEGLIRERDALLGITGGRA